MSAARSRPSWVGNSLVASLAALIAPPFARHRAERSSPRRRATQTGGRRPPLTVPGPKEPSRLTGPSSYIGRAPLRQLADQRLGLPDEAQDLLLAARGEEREPRHAEVAVALRGIDVGARRRRDADLERSELRGPRNGAGRRGEAREVLPRGL